MKILVLILGNVSLIYAQIQYNMPFWVAILMIWWLMYILGLIGPHKATGEEDSDESSN